jgi:tetratricopeptide (TPR) repeat protein
MSTDLEPLLGKLTGFAPLFGRAREDIDAMASRARAGDYKGVLQNARLVLEALLRSLVTDELKQTPGKAMLDELVSKFRQQANAGIIPTNVLAHMGTVQAWGNLSSHDHAGSLSDQAVSVGPDEVMASLNSMVAILSWYATRKNLTPVAGAAAVARRPSAPTLSNRTLIATALAATLGVSAAVAIKTTNDAKKAALEASPPQPVNRFEALDAVYASWKEPPPPARCRNEKEAAQLAKDATNLDALGLIDKPSPEASYLLARAFFKERKTRSDALAAALACDDFAAAQYLAGLVVIASNGDLDEARSRFEKAKAMAPGFLDARSKLGAVYLQLNQLPKALAEAEALVAAAPDYHPGFVVRGSARAADGDLEGAFKDYCAAQKLGSSVARKSLEDMKRTCD